MKNKDKYDLRDISYTIECDDCKYEFVIYCNFIEIHRESFGNCDSRCGAFTKWLEEEYVPEILTEREKAYLSAVIKPFREDIEYIEKFKSNYVGKEYIYIVMKKDDDYCKLPRFFKGTMYRGMELNKRYTLGELGL